MKPEKKISFINLLSVSILAVGVFATGCVAQTGTAEDPASSEQELNTAPNANANPGATRAGTGIAVEKNVAPVEKIIEKDGLNGSPTDPGTNNTDDGDGREPDPHPWVTVPGNGAVKR